MENIQPKKRYRRRCNKCKNRISLFIFKRGKYIYCKCPKCGAEGIFFPKKKISLAD